MIYKAFFDLDNLKEEYSKLQKEVDDPNFWKDLDKAKTTNKYLSEIANKISLITSLNKDMADVNAYFELIKEEKDESLFDEIDLLLEKIDTQISSFERRLLYSGKYDDLPAILEFHPGAGGTEAHDWASMLYRMYSRYASDNGYKLKVIDMLVGEEAGISSATVIISAKYAYGNLKSEKGFQYFKEVIMLFLDNKSHFIERFPEIEKKYVINNFELRCKRCYTLPFFSINSQKQIIVTYKCGHLKKKGI